MSLREAGALGVPFITAYHGLVEAGGVERGDVVLVLGGNGKVGQAAIQLATVWGARVFAVERTREEFGGHATAPVEMIDASATDIATYVRDKTDGHGADIVYNTVGSPYFESASKAMAKGGRQILISTIERAVAFDIFAFYRVATSSSGSTLALNSGIAPNPRRSEAGLRVRRCAFPVPRPPYSAGRGQTSLPRRDRRIAGADRARAGRHRTTADASRTVARETALVQKHADGAPASNPQPERRRKVMEIKATQGGKPFYKILYVQVLFAMAGRRAWPLVADCRWR